MITTTIDDHFEKIKSALPFCLAETKMNQGKKYQGKVRDIYEIDDYLLLISTDRLSAFDRVLTVVPYKGQVLNLTSAWWFEKTQHIVPNHVIKVPDPNVTVAKKCKVFPIEFVVRGFITGSTVTSLWKHYENGSRNYCGHHLPSGLRKNQKLAQPLLTPTTKEKHDRPISAAEIVSEGWMSAQDFAEVSEVAMRLYCYGAEIALQHGLILVDTKYEFGKDADGKIRLIDEIHTPDSSRYWLSATYEKNFNACKEPDHIDKEFIRLWFKEHSNPYEDAMLPKAPHDLIITLASRYIQLYEMITGATFNFPPHPFPPLERIEHNLAEFLS